MFNRHKKVLAVSSALGLLVAATHWRLAHSSSASPGPSPSTPLADETTLEAQVSEDVDLALHLNSKAKTFGEWALSGFTPKDIFRYIAQLNNPNGWEALCEKLTSLPGEDLALFEDPILHAEKGQILPCRQGLTSRLQIFWQNARSQVADSYSPVHANLAVETKPVSMAEWFRDEIHVEPKHVTLTFNGGPHIERTEPILDILSSAGVRAMFFQTGLKSRQHAKLSLRMAEGGHIIGSETNSDALLTRLPLAQAKKEIETGHQRVSAVTGQQIPFFRYPYDESSEELQALLKDQKLIPISWDIDSLDWKIRDPAKLLRHLLAEVEDSQGGIILMHDRYEQTVIMLPALLAYLAELGYTETVFVPH